MEMMEIIYLIGPPGCGKSTWRNDYLSKNPDFVVVSSDDFIDSYAAERGISYSLAFPLAVKLADSHCKAVFAAAVAEGKSIIIDRTNMSRKSRMSWRSSIGKDLDVYYTAVMFSVPRDVLDARLAARAAETGKNIPRHVVDMMIKNFDEPTMDEFFAISHIGFDNS
jgi:predicted kinase